MDGQWLRETLQLACLLLVRTPYERDSLDYPSSGQYQLPNGCDIGGSGLGRRNKSRVLVTHGNIRRESHQAEPSASRYMFRSVPTCGGCSFVVERRRVAAPWAALSRDLPDGGRLGGRLGADGVLFVRARYISMDVDGPRWPCQSPSPALRSLEAGSFCTVRSPVS
jgi:hypothetical protein